MLILSVDYLTPEDYKNYYFHSRSLGHESKHLNRHPLEEGSLTNEQQAGTTDKRGSCHVCHKQTWHAPPRRYFTPVSLWRYQTRQISADRWEHSNKYEYQYHASVHRQHWFHHFLNFSVGHRAAHK